MPETAFFIRDGIPLGGTKEQQRCRLCGCYPLCYLFWRLNGETKKLIAKALEPGAECPNYRPKKKRGEVNHA